MTMFGSRFSFAFVCFLVTVYCIYPVTSNVTEEEKKEISLLLKFIETHRALANISQHDIVDFGSNRTTGQNEMSDTDVISGSCGPEEFFCSWDHTCLRANWVCNGAIDCTDGSDEIDCFECVFDFPVGFLIPMNRVCDGIEDCLYGLDEHSCKPRCDNAHFSCCDGVRASEVPCPCMPAEWQCDSIPDCPNNYDESEELCGPPSARCGEDQYICRHLSFCIPWRWLCDGENDCGDDSDEDRCGSDYVDWRESASNNTGAFDWSGWSEWSSCSSECDGEQTRTRKCLSGQCSGETAQTGSCGKKYPCVTEQTTGCGTREFEAPMARVVGGRNAQLHEWPWQVQVFRPSWNIPFCGGSLIKSDWVLSAAHCFHKKKYKPTDYFVGLGRSHTSRRTTDDSEQYVGVSHAIIHEYYVESSHRNDIALLRLQNEAQLGIGVNLVCLPSVSDWLWNATAEPECFVTGFGVDQMGKRPSVMQEAKVRLITHETCTKPYVYGTRVTDDMICAGHLQGNVDACQGDSGGPLVCQHPRERRWYQVGITSWGRGCGLPNRPGVYTAISSYIDWISRYVS